MNTKQMRFSIAVAVLLGWLGSSALAQPAPAADKIFADPSLSNNLIEKGRQYFLAGDYVNSLKALEDALRFCPNNARIYLDSAMRKQASGDFAGARADIIQANRGYPKLGLIFYFSGHARLQILDFYGAISDLSLSIYISPEELVQYVPRGLARYETGDFQGAIEDYTVPIESRKKPDLDFAYMYRGRACFELGDGPGALADTTAAINIRPNFVPAYYLRALQLQRNGDVAAAILDCDAALKAEPGTRYMIFIRMWLYHELKDSKSAHRDADLVIKIAPDRPASWYYRGALFDTEEQVDLAIADYLKAISLANDSQGRATWIYVNFFVDLLSRRTGRTDRKDYLKDVFTWPDDWPKRIGIYLAGHTSDESLVRDARNTKNIFTKHQQEAEAYYYIGMINLIKGSNQEAQDYFKRSVDTKQVQLTEYNLALEQLQRLQK